MMETPKENCDSIRWETGWKVEIPEFYGSLQPEEFIDWIIIVEVLDFKEVPHNKRVQLVITRCHGKAATWWQQTKLTQARRGKTKLESWEKQKKKICTKPFYHITKQGCCTNNSKT